MKQENVMFTVGDVVRHKASGRLAVVSDICVGCVTHETAIDCLCNKNDCVYKKTGKLLVKIDFDKQYEVDSFEIERVST